MTYRRQPQSIRGCSLVNLLWIYRNTGDSTLFKSALSTLEQHNQLVSLNNVVRNLSTSYSLVQKIASACFINHQQRTILYHISSTTLSSKRHPIPPTPPKPRTPFEPVDYLATAHLLDLARRLFLRLFYFLFLFSLISLSLVKPSIVIWFQRHLLLDGLL